MLVLVSFGLVLLATILLVVGLLSGDSLTLIYLSILASASAAVVLYLAFRFARPKGEGASTAPAALDDDVAPQDLSAPPVAASAPAPATVSDEAVAEAVEAEPVVEEEAAVVGAATDEEWMASDSEWEDDGAIFPIADYDDLTVAEILPLLPQLYSDELGVVAARERAGRNRTTILGRLEELAASGTEADAAEVAPDESPAAVPAPTPAPAAEPVAVAPLVAPVEDDDPAEFFPIADYDELSVAQVVPLLAQLEPDELEDVRARETSGANRKTLLAEIDRALDGGAAPTPEPEPAPAPAPAPARKTAAKKAPAKKAPAKKAPAKKAPATKAARKTTKKKSAPRFPIANYDDLTVADIRPRLVDLSDGQLQQVREREAAGAGRKTVLKDIDNRLS